MPLVPLDLLNINLGLVLELQRRISKPPSSHVNKLKCVILSQKFVITENVNLEDGKQNGK